MTWAAFRTSQTHHKARPRANYRAARYAWDWFAKGGPIESIRLLDGEWFCKRPDGSMDSIEATLRSSWSTTTGEGA